MQRMTFTNVVVSGATIWGIIISGYFFGSCALPFRESGDTGELGSFTHYTNTKLGLRLRKGPGSKFEAMISLPMGYKVRTLEKTAKYTLVDGLRGRWYRITAMGRDGWVFGYYMKRVPSLLMLAALPRELRGCWMNQQKNLMYHIKKNRITYRVGSMPPSWSCRLIEASSFLNNRTVRCETAEMISEIQFLIRSHEELDGDAGRLRRSDCKTILKDY